MSTTLFGILKKQQWNGNTNVIKRQQQNESRHFTMSEIIINVQSALLCFQYRSLVDDGRIVSLVQKPVDYFKSTGNRKKLCALNNQYLKLQLSILVSKESLLIKSEGM